MCTDHFDLSVGGTVLARYVYQPEAPQVESPKPYFEPVRTLAGDVVRCSVRTTMCGTKAFT